MMSLRKGKPVKKNLRNINTKKKKSGKIKYCKLMNSYFLYFFFLSTFHFDAKRKSEEKVDNKYCLLS